MSESTQRLATLHESLDHTEAVLINAVYDSLAEDEQINGDLPALATDEAEHNIQQIAGSSPAADHLRKRLTGIVCVEYMDDPDFKSDPEQAATQDIRALESITERFPAGIDYETAKKARRWWNFKAAHINDLEPHYAELDDLAEGDPWQFGLEERFVTFKEKLDELKEANDEAASYILVGDPLTYALYARLEAERIKLGSKELKNPEEIETGFALKALLNTLDKVVDNDGKRTDQGTDMYETMLVDERDAFDCTVERAQAHQTKIYDVSMYTGREKSMITTDDSRVPLVNYRFAETGSVIGVETGSMYGPALVDARTILGLARNLSPDQEYSFERPQQDKKP